MAKRQQLTHIHPGGPSVCLLDQRLLRQGSRIAQWYLIPEPHNGVRLELCYYPPISYVEVLNPV